MSASFHPVSFGSDNHAGVHPEVLEAIARVASGHVTAYGNDPITRQLEERVRELFGAQASCFPVFNGTAANVLSLSLCTRSFEAVICTTNSHIHNDECGAPEKFLGSKLMPLATPDGKLTPHILKHAVKGVGDQHHVQPKTISFAQSTEVGTVYTADEIRALSDFARANGMYLHMDGARIANAAASLGCSFRELTTDAGVDVLSFGGTKNGLLGAEAVIILNPELSRHALFVRKQGMQLASKMRFISAQLLAALSNDLWLRNARHANAMARLLESELRGTPGLEIRYPVQSNGVFASLPREAIQKLQQKYVFYVWDEGELMVRWMTAFDTPEAEVRAFAQAIREACGRGNHPAPISF